MADVTTTAAPPDTSDQCPRCEGTGRYQRPVYGVNGVGVLATIYKETSCALCRGTGLMSVAVTGGDAEPATVDTTEDDLRRVEELADLEAAWDRVNRCMTGTNRNEVYPGNPDWRTETIPHPNGVDTWPKYEERTICQLQASHSFCELERDRDTLVRSVPRLAASLRAAVAEIEKARLANATFAVCLPEIMSQRDAARSRIAEVAAERDQLREKVDDLTSDPGGYLAVGGFIEQIKQAESERDTARAKLDALRNSNPKEST